MQVLSSMLGSETMGWAAALLTLLTFVSSDMRRLRLLALAANATFIAYGTAANLLPVMVLHLALVPVNLWRLNQAFRSDMPTRTVQHAPDHRPARRPKRVALSMEPARLGPYRPLNLRLHARPWPPLAAVRPSASPCSAPGTDRVSDR